MKKKVVKSAKKVLKKKSAKKATSQKTSEEKALSGSLYRISINARRRAYSKKAAVTIIRNGKIVQIYPGKKEKVLGTVQTPDLNIDLHKPIKIK